MQQEIRYKAPWPIYAMSWTTRPEDSWRIALGSFTQDFNNKLQVISLNTDGSGFHKVAEEDHHYPITKTAWMPYKGALSPDLLATSGEFLRIWEVGKEDGLLKKKATLANNAKNNDYSAPITSFDWNEINNGIIGTCSIDTTCSIWDLETQTVTTQLIAHDKEVFDMGFTINSQDIFASAGADGSIRMFDLRNLEHSTIIYETPDGSPLLRLTWNRQDPNYLATFHVDSAKVIVLDIRVPSIPVTELQGHTASVNACIWAPHSSVHMCTAGDDSRALVWELGVMKKYTQDPILGYTASSEINQLSWSRCHPEWLAIASGDMLEALKI